MTLWHRQIWAVWYRSFPGTLYFTGLKAVQLNSWTDGIAGEAANG
jgi:hypothetical protein